MGRTAPLLVCLFLLVSGTFARDLRTLQSAGRGSLVKSALAKHSSGFKAQSDATTPLTFGANTFYPLSGASTALGTANWADWVLNSISAGAFTAETAGWAYPVNSSVGTTDATFVNVDEQAVGIVSLAAADHYIPSTYAAVTTGGATTALVATSGYGAMCAYNFNTWDGMTRDSAQWDFPDAAKGDNFLSLRAQQKVHDESFFWFRATPNYCGTVTFPYLFGSEDYPGTNLDNDVADFTFNDLLVLEINGTNVATLPGSSTNVTLKTLHDPSEFYLDNYWNEDPDDNAPKIEFEGFSTLLTTKAFPVVKGSRIPFKFGVADGSGDALGGADTYEDHASDAGVYIWPATFARSNCPVSCRSGIKVITTATASGAWSTVNMNTLRVVADPDGGVVTYNYKFWSTEAASAKTNATTISCPDASATTPTTDGIVTVRAEKTPKVATRWYKIDVTATDAIPSGSGTAACSGCKTTTCTTSVYVCVKASGASDSVCNVVPQNSKFSFKADLTGAQCNLSS